MNDVLTPRPNADLILNLAKEGKTGEIETIWLELIEDPPQEADYYTRLIQALQKAEALETAHGLIVLLLEQAQERSDWKFSYRVLNVACVSWPDSKPLRALASRALRGHFSSNPNLDAMLTASKIGDAPLDQALKRFRSFLRLGPGQVFQHKAWGEGVVRSLDIPGGKLVLDFPSEKGKSLTFEGVRNFLTHLPPDHFLARRAKDPDKLWELGEDDPVALIKMALACSGGRIKQSHLKSQLLGTIVPQGSWTSWWNRSRQALRMEPMVDFNAKGGAHGEIVMRDRPKSFEEEIQDLFFAADADLAGRISAAQKMLDAQKTFTPQPKMIEKMLKRLEEDFRVSKDLKPIERLETAYLAEDLRGMMPAKTVSLDRDVSAIPKPEASLEEIHDFAELNEMAHVNYAMRALRVMMARAGAQGIEQASQFLPSASIKLAQAIWRELDEEHHLEHAVKALEGLFENPLRNPDTYFWAVKAIIEGSWNHLEDYFPLVWVIPHLLDDMAEWQDTVEDQRAAKTNAANAKHLLSKSRALLQARHYAAICSAAEAMSLEQAQRLRRSIQLNPALNDAFRSGADRQLTLTRKDLAQDGAVPVEAEFHYCTAKMRSVKLRELAELNNVIIPANSREIEEARQEGDLKENAGYHAAKDKQKMLMQQTLQLQQGLSEARIFTASMVRTESIGFGTSFVADNLKQGKQESYTILGRWEADPERKILSYLAPMVKQFLGKKSGEETVIRHPGGGETPYRVVSITNALVSGEWETAEE